MEDFIIKECSIVFILESDVNTVSQGGINVSLQINQPNQNQEKNPSYYINQFDLSKSGVIDKNWEELERPTYYGSFAKISYTNGITIEGDFNKFSISNSFEQIVHKDFIKRTKKLYDMIADKTKGKIIQMGVNFILVLPTDDPSQYFYDNFLNKNIFGKLQKSISLPYARVSYELEDNKKLNLSIGIQKTKDLKNNNFTQDECVVVQANFHNELHGNNKLVAGILTNSDGLVDDYLRKIFSIKG
jgi:hypothetical protein